MPLTCAIVVAVPEGDTIHHAAARMREVLEGRVPEQIVMRHPRHRFERWAERLAGMAVRSVDVHGKHLFMRFDGDLTVHSHLRMTGSWGIYGHGERWRRSAARAWLVVRSGEWEVVEFDGPVLELVMDSRTRTDRRLVSLGPDVLGERFDSVSFLRRLRAGDRTRPIGEALLDQRTIAGIGNVWKSECCFALGVDPWRAVGDISDEEAIGLIDFARDHMRVSARDGIAARPGNVYRRAGRPCPRCGTPISGRGQGESNRLTYWCPDCQR
jgi:endonuclease VIII